jgi:hypothetical protein
MEAERRLWATTEITPDDKDWTSVLERPCPECGFDAGAVAPADVPALLRDVHDVRAGLAATDR